MHDFTHSFAIIPSCSRDELWGKYPKNKLGTNGFNVKLEDKTKVHNCVLALSSNPQIKVRDFTSLMQRTAKICANMRAARAARLFLLF